MTSRTTSPTRSTTSPTTRSPSHGEGAGLPHMLLLEIRNDHHRRRGRQRRWASSAGRWPARGPAASRIMADFPTTATSRSTAKHRRCSSSTCRISPPVARAASSRTFRTRDRSEIRLLFRAAKSVSIPNMRRLQAAFRAAGIEVLYTTIESLTKDGRDRSLDYKITGFHVPKGSWDGKVIDEIAPAEDEIVLPKSLVERLRLHPYRLSAAQSRRAAAGDLRPGHRPVRRVGHPRRLRPRLPRDAGHATPARPTPRSGMTTRFAPSRAIAAKCLLQS